MDISLLLYLSWLIPSCVSFVSSCAVIAYICYLKKGLLSQLFHQLCLGLALADLVQCSSWFLGNTA